MLPEGIAAPEGKVLSFDGVAIVRRGDTLFICYQLAARLHRTRWLFDVIDDMAGRVSSDLLVVLVVLPTADPPDGPTLMENRARMDKLGSKIRRLVTAAMGDAFKISVVRAVMRGLNVVLGYSRTRFVVDSLEAALDLAFQAKTAKTPARSQMISDIGALYTALGEPTPKISSEAASKPLHG